MASTEQSMPVRQAHLDHLRGGYSEMAQRNALEPATGNQLWRLNALGLIGVALQTEVDYGTKTYVTRGTASELLQQAKDEGLF